MKREKHLLSLCGEASPPDIFSQGGKCVEMMIVFNDAQVDATNRRTVELTSNASSTLTIAPRHCISPSLAFRVARTSNSISDQVRYFMQLRISRRFASLGSLSLSRSDGYALEGEKERQRGGDIGKTAGRFGGYTKYGRCTRGNDFE